MKNGCCGQRIGVRTKRVGPRLVIFRRFGLGAFVVLFTAGLLHAQFSDPVGIPERGVTPAGFYSTTDIETIDAVHGNLLLKIPITSFPAGRTASTASLELAYNSTNDAWSGTELVNSSFIDPYDSGGWHYSFNYSFTNDFQSEVDQANCSSTTNYYYFRYRLVTPDGSSHILFIRDRNNDVLNGYYPYQSINCALAYETGTVSLYTADGTYLRMTLTVNSISPDGSGGYRVGGSWTLYLPDGHIVTGQDESTTRIADRNGNGFSISRDNPAPGAYTTTLTDDLGRTITLQQTASGQDIITQQVTDTSSGSNVPSPQTLTWTVNWGAVSLDPQTHHYQCYHPPDPPTTCYAPNELVVTSLVLPSQLNPQNPLRYTFTYYCTNIEPDCPVLQWGQLNGMTLPTDAQVQYTYDSQPVGPVHGVAPFRIVSKTLTWQDPIDSTQHTETTSYSFASTQSIFTNPDGGTETHLFYDVSNPNPDWHNGLVYSVTEPSGDRVEHVWSTNVPKGGNPSSAPPYHVPGNPIVLQELTTKAGGSLTSARVLAYDRNGNRTQINEYDFTGFSGGVVVRASVNTYLNGAGPAIAGSPGAAIEDSAGYWTDHTPQLLNLVAKTAVSGSGPGSVTSFVYDNGTLSRGNVTQENRWDSTRGGQTDTNTYETVVNTYDGYATTQGDFSALCANAGSIGSFGNLAVTKNAAGHATVFCYDADAARLVRRIDAAGTSDARTFNYSYDSTGLTANVQSVTDQDHSVVRSFFWDAFGRNVKETEGNNTTVVRTTKTTYNDVLRTITINSDRESNGDSALVETTSFDQLERLWLSQDWAGNYIQKRFQIPSQTGFSYELTSNPYLNLQGNESTMGWTRTKRDTGGRIVEVNHFSGSVLPPPWGSNAMSTGAATTTYIGNTVTVVDEAGVSRTNHMDGLGRLYSVDENGISATTTYGYDALDNLTSVTQSGAAARTFVYSSLSRLTSAKNPESGPVIAGVADISPVAYTYYPGGNLHTKTDSRSTPITTTYTYNNLDQLTDKQYSDSGSSNPTPSVHNTYDKSWLTSVQSGPWSYTYSNPDPIGRMQIGSQVLSGGATSTFSVKYKPLIGVESITYPGSGRKITTTYDNGGRPVSVYGQIGSNPQTNYVTGTTYQPHGAIQTQTLANGNLTISRADNSRLQAVSINVQNGNLLGLSYGYSATNNNGNVLSQTISHPGLGTWTQTYDYHENGTAGANRLTSAQESAGGTGTWSQTYGYDNRGNRWVNPNAIPYPSPFTPSSPSNYDTFNHLNIQNSSYDGGNQMQIGGFQFQYDAENRLTNSTFTIGQAAQYQYDGLGHRVTKTAGGHTMMYVYDPFGNLAQEYGPADETSTEYLVTDALGSTRLVTDNSGTSAVRCYDYLPFGEEIAAGTAGRAAPCFGTATYPASGPDVVNPKFTGKERDAETGLDNFLARYYSGAQGRFTSPDKPLIDQYPDDPQSWNLYSYVRNNPLNAIDPNGQDCIYINDNTVGLERGNCSQKNGTYVAGTIDAKSFTYNASKGTLGYSYTNNGALGTGVIEGVRPPSSESRADIFIGEMARRRDASNQAIGLFAAWQGVYATAFVGTYAGPAAIAALAAGGEAGILRFGNKAFDIVRDATGRVHGDLPKFIPKNVTREQLEFAAQELRASIQVRMQNMVQLGDQGNHGLRLAEEQRLLYRIQQRLGQR